MKIFSAAPIIAIFGGKASAFDISIHEDITQLLEGEEYENLKFRQVALDQVRSSNANTDYLGFANAVNHCDSELLSECSQKIVNDLNRAANFLRESPPNGNEARKAFGSAIHTGQDFYAHSNWANVYTDATIETRLGVSALANPPLATAFCENDDGGALLPNPERVITTGYFYFSCFSDPPQGKCIHGYKGITSPPFCRARNGINKDNGSIVLHDRALSQATQATKTFLQNLLTRDGIGEDQIAAFFGQKSVAIVIDTSGSMGDDITSVKNAVIASVVNNPAVVNEKPRLILSEFNDPGVGPMTVTDDPSEFLSALTSISVSGGGDCPELSTKGTLLAVQKSFPNSKLWVFSDASAKDGSLYPLLRAEARSKNIQINYGLTGSCSSRRAGRQLLSVDPIYTDLAFQTGGQVFRGPKDEVGNIFSDIDLQIRDDFVTLCRVILSLPASVPAKVDDSLESIIFSTSIFDGSIDSIEIVRPDGSIVSDTDPNVTISKLGDNEVVTILDPLVGEWRAQVTGTGTTTVIVQGNSPININYFKFVDLVVGRYQYMYVETPGGNPIEDGSNLATALTRVEGPVTGSVEYRLVGVAGNDLMTSIEEKEDVDNTMVATGDTVLKIEIPDEPFSVMVAGVTPSGNPFNRLAVAVYTPQTIKVSTDPLSLPAEVPEGVNTTIQFLIENFGDELIEVDVGVMDTLGYVESFSPMRAEIPANSSDTINITLAPPLNCTEDVTRITVTATLVGELIGNADIIDLVVCEEMSTPSPQTLSPTSSPTPSPTAGKKITKPGSGKSGKSGGKDTSKSSTSGKSGKSSVGKSSNKLSSTSGKSGKSSGGKFGNKLQCQSFGFKGDFNTLERFEEVGSTAVWKIGSVTVQCGWGGGWNDGSCAIPPPSEDIFMSGINVKGGERPFLTQVSLTYPFVKKGESSYLTFVGIFTIDDGPDPADLVLTGGPAGAGLSGSLSYLVDDNKAIGSLVICGI